VFRGKGSGLGTNIDAQYHLQLMNRIQDWRELLLKFTQTISKPNLLIGYTNDARDSNGNEVEAADSDSKVSRYISVLNSLGNCRSAATTLVNIQLAVISLHQLLNQVSS
jgi:hypothetical protein